MQQLLFYREHETEFLAALEFEYNQSGKEALIHHILGILENEGKALCPCVDTAYPVIPKENALSIIMRYADENGLSDHQICFECPWEATRHAIEQALIDFKIISVHSSCQPQKYIL